MSFVFFLSITKYLLTLKFPFTFGSRYLEDSIMKLDTHHPVTKSHLPVVVAEVSKNLNAFLHTFPSHMSSRRIKMIIMAANSLLKESVCTKQ